MGGLVLALTQVMSGAPDEEVDHQRYHFFERWFKRRM